jgi:hypothetical protein
MYEVSYVKKIRNDWKKWNLRSNGNTWIKEKRGINGNPWIIWFSYG